MRILGMLLLAAGILIAGTAGLCSLAMLGGAPTESGLWILVALFGGIPFAGGLGLCFAGRTLLLRARDERGGTRVDEDTFS